MTEQSDKYSFEKIPLSERTKEGMSLNIDDLGAIGRMMTIQDDYYEEQMDKLFKGMCSLNKKVESMTRLIRKTSKALEDTLKEVSEIKDAG